MIKKTISYVDYNGIKRTEDFYFHLNKAELMEMEMSINGGFVEQVKALIKASDQAAIIKIFKDIIFKSYGKRSLDGREFIKSDELARSFSYTEAYSILFMELATDDVKAAEFIKGIMPDDVREEAEKKMGAGPMSIEQLDNM